jgi:phosphatidate cytidylyltransferase
MTWKRIATALVLIPVVVALVLYTSTIVVAIATAVITLLALREFFALGDAIGHRAYKLWTVFCALSFLAVQLVDALWQTSAPSGSFTVVIAGHSIGAPPATTPLFFVFVLGLTVITLFTHRPLVEALPAAGISSAALLLVAFPLSFAVRLHGLPFEGRYLLLFALAITWAADTSAYFVGSAIGKHPLAPHISPRKTWEGSIGSMVGSLIAAAILARWIDISLTHLFVMAVIGNIAGQMGDLLESACKRSAGVKDSGGLLPGHGGILDRIDALILCFPVLWYYLVLVHPLI